MSTGVATWDRFVARGHSLATRLCDGMRELAANPEDRDRMSALAYDAFAIAGPALLLGAERVGRLALACETCLDHVAAGRLEIAHALPVLASSSDTLHAAFLELERADRSGARIEGTPLDAALYELETLFPGAGSPSGDAPDVPVSALRRAPPDEIVTEPVEPAFGPPAVVDARSGPEIWEPTVDEDMVEIFFEEVNDRLEALSVKLLDIEQRPDDTELLRDVFRDLHTVKGSSAMVGLQAMNDLAHAAEDLVGQLRDGHRSADGPVIDALLAALDRLRDIAGAAQSRQPIPGDAGVVRRLREPGSHLDEDDGDEAPAPVPGASAAEAPAPPAQRRDVNRQTIRVDFDKLDRLMNLVGELVIGRDGLRGAIGALGSLSAEIASGRQLSRHLRIATGTRGTASSRMPRAPARRGLSELGDELSRVERVLSDISHELDQSSGRLDSISAELRDSVMNLRMIPVGGVFRKHHRTVRDLANALGKRVRLELSGEETELDKLLVEALDEPLMHLVRNAVDHGVEDPDERIAAGKPPEGTVRLAAMHRGSQVVIRIEDDGAGIDLDKVRARALERGVCSPEELEDLDERGIYELIFRPGFSTAEVISEVSGRGVGMDVVRQSIVSQLKGTIDIDGTPGQGSSFTLRLPLTLAIGQVLLARAGGEVLAVPLDSVVRTIARPSKDVQLVQNQEVITVREQQVPLIRVDEVLELATGDDTATQLQIILTDVSGDLFGLVVDGLLEKKEIVIKSLGDVLEVVPCAAGATLLGDSCALILDVPALVARALRRGAPPRREPPVAASTPADASARAPHVLVVEDSDIVRESIRRLLTSAGYQVTTARDGVEGLEACQRAIFDLVSTDVMMPRMDGYELTRALRNSEGHRDIPIVMVTSKGERIDRVRGFDAGVDEYITKPHDRHVLLRTVGKLLGEKAPGETP